MHPAVTENVSYYIVIHYVKIWHVRRGGGGGGGATNMHPLSWERHKRKRSNIVVAAFGLFPLSASLKAREQVREMGLEPGDVEPEACLYYEGTTDVLKMCQFVCPGCVHFSRHSPKCLGKECYCCDRYKKN